MKHLMKQKNTRGLFTALTLSCMVIVMSISTQPICYGTQGKPNRLVKELSPYLLQHANNPVDWYPWGPKAFAKALAEDKPIFMSIGYATCHWCHVMEHESFEDAEVAKLMNETYICIKVDREERPDIDNVYMQVCQMITGSGGWPMTIIMTPDKKPFFAGTYIPKTNRYGRMGMIDLTQKIKGLWSDIQKRQSLLENADKIVKSLQRPSGSSTTVELGESTFKYAYNGLKRSFDHNTGGFGSAPKFPTPHNLGFLLRYWYRHQDQDALNMVETTLKAMRAGGIYDHIGYGFHRYSTDYKWLVPHFEKMLYDQALIAQLYLSTYQVTGKEEYAQTAKEIFDYVIREMTDPAGGFYCAQDADSEGVEGKYYVWTHEQLKAILDKNELEIISTVFNVTADGNFTLEGEGKDNKTNILHLQKPKNELAKELKLTPGQLEQQLQAARKKLLTARFKRIHPLKDDKILTDWNGLMIGAMAQGGRILNEPRYTIAAQKATDFIISKMINDKDKLLHRYRKGQAAITATLDDYAFMVYGLLELYETVFDVKYLQAAINLNNSMIDNFWDTKDGGLFQTANDAEKLLVRYKDIYDGAIPSGNSIAMLNMLRLGRITVNTELEDKAQKLANHFARRVQMRPTGYTQLLMAIDFAVGPSFEIVVAGNPNTTGTKNMLNSINSKFIPNKIVLLRPDGNSPGITKLAPFTEQQKSINKKATAYICQNYNCQQPTTEIKQLEKLLVNNSGE